MTTVRPHDFDPDLEHRNHRGDYVDCLLCPLPPSNAIHKTALTAAEIRREEARRLGEHDEYDGGK